MLIYDALKKDHRDLQDLLKLMETTLEDTAALRMELLTRLRALLIPHIQAEESVLYETLKEINETEDLALEACEEHHAIELLLRELEAIEPSDGRWRAKLATLKENLDHHITQEQTEMFENARQVLAPDEARMMAEAFFRLKADIMRGSSLQNALDKITQLLPPRFSHRFSQLSRRL